MSEARRHIEVHRQIRNHAVREYYSPNPRKRPTIYEQHSKLTAWKQRWPVFSDALAYAAQQTVSKIHGNLKTLRKRHEKGHDVGQLGL